MTTLHRAIAGRRGQAVLRLLAVGGLAAMLAGCYETAPVAQLDFPMDYRDRHPITLKEGEHTVQVFVGRNRGGLTPSQRADVLSFAQLWRREASSGIVVDVPHGGPTDRAAADSMRDIQSTLAASGIPRRAIFVRHYRPSRTSLASITLNYTKLVAHAGPCGLWPDDLGPAAHVPYDENMPYWNFGCAYQRNLAAMVDNPADLVQPRGETPPYAGRRSVTFDKYRKGESPSGKYDGYDQAKIGDVGK
jgi:pilus assembly protein CpaD